MVGVEWLVTDGYGGIREGGIDGYLKIMGNTVMVES